jgi:hypothetical protein
MQNKFYIKLLVIVTCFLAGFLRSEGQSQGEQRDTMAFIKIYNSQLLDPYTLRFDLYVERKSERWLKFVNGTFSMNFEDSTNFKIGSGNITVEQTITQLKYDVAPGNDIPTTGYRTDFQVYDNRLTITVLGPEKFDDCHSVNLDNPLLIGTFVVRSTTGERFPNDRMMWMTPYKWYQACAFKIPQDSLFNGDITLYYSDDNLSMEDSTSITYVFINDTTQKVFQLDYFTADYIGKLKTQYYWMTKKEYNILGYSVYRGIPSGNDVDEDYKTLVSTWRPGDKYNPELVVKTYNPIPKFYGLYPDELEFRGGYYCYALYGSFLEIDGSITERFLDTACVPTPRAVISYAGAAPEVFSDETTISYTVDDDVYLTAFLTDLLGKELKKLTVPNWGLLDRKEVRSGTYSFKFRAPDLASQGFYNIRFVAYPINDPTADVSTADVKLQLIK